MIKKLLYFLIICSVASFAASQIKQPIKVEVSDSHYNGQVGHIEITHDAEEHISNDKVIDHSDHKYSSGAELTSLAHSSALQAKTAVQNQHTAGNQAAFGAKSTLANAAIGAAMTAQAALVGKQVIVHGLKKQLAEAENQLHAELSQLEQTETAATAAAEAAHQAQVTAQAISGAAASAQGAATHATQAATETAKASAAQHAMVVEAKQKVGHITEKLHMALAELQQTEAAAQKALASAHIAQSNAAAAGAAVVSAASQKQSNHELDHQAGNFYH